MPVLSEPFFLVRSFETGSCTCPHEAAPHDHFARNNTNTPLHHLCCILTRTVEIQTYAALKKDEADEFAVKLEQAATKHPQVLYEAKVLKILSGGGAFVQLCTAKF